MGGINNVYHAVRLGHDIRVRAGSTDWILTLRSRVSAGSRLNNIMGGGDGAIPGL